MVLGRYSPFRRRRISLPKNATFRITQEGSDKIRDGVMTAQMRVLIAIQTIGSSADLNEIAMHSGLGRGHTERVVVQLIQKGYVQRVGVGGMMPSEDAEVE